VADETPPQQLAARRLQTVNRAARQHADHMVLVAGVARPVATGQGDRVQRWLRVVSRLRLDRLIADLDQGPFAVGDEPRRFDQFGVGGQFRIPGDFHLAVLVALPVQQHVADAERLDRIACLGRLAHRLDGFRQPLAHVDVAVGQFDVLVDPRQLGLDGLALRRGHVSRIVDQLHRLFGQRDQFLGALHVGLRASLRSESVGDVGQDRRQFGTHLRKRRLVLDPRQFLLGRLQGLRFVARPFHRLPHPPRADLDARQAGIGVFGEARQELLVLGDRLRIGRRPVVVVGRLQHLRRRAARQREVQGDSQQDDQHQGAADHVQQLRIPDVLPQCRFLSPQTAFLRHSAAGRRSGRLHVVEAFKTRIRQRFEPRIRTHRLQSSDRFQADWFDTVRVR
jgi:hypothetical protein